MEKQIEAFYQKKHKKECEETRTLIPQTLLGKKLRHIIRLINDIKSLEARERLD